MRALYTFIPLWVTIDTASRLRRAQVPGYSPGIHLLESRRYIMRNRFIPLALVMVSIGLAGQLSAQPITSRVAALPSDAKLAGPGVVYSNSFFQERYMQLGRTIAYGLFIGGAFQQAVWRATGKYEGKAPVRQEANAFEQLLGDFDVTGHVNQRLRARISEARHLEIEFTNDAALAEALVSLASSGTKAGDEVKIAAQGRDVMCVVKVSYGFGARAGREQLGFKKTYRPFIRLLSVVRKNSTGEVIWHGAVIAWAAKGYKGREAKEISREELLDTFKTVSDDAISLLIRSLNGESLSPMGDLVDETKEDGRF
jgi:hypothetical protein